MDKFALVTGASLGIGREIARSLAAKGVFVLVNYATSRDSAEQVVAEIRGAGGKAAALQADVTDETGIAALFSSLARLTDRLDYLVNNAGIDTPQPFETFQSHAWRRIIDVNLTGKFLVLQHAIPFLKKSPGARVVNISSRLAFEAFEESSAYCCSQAAIVMMTKCAALELAPHGIRVNAVCPGLTPTPLTERLFPDAGIWKNAAAGNPSGRVGSTRDMANAVMFLLSDEAAYVNGTHLLVEGGGSLT